MIFIADHRSKVVADHYVEEEKKFNIILEQFIF